MHSTRKVKDDLIYVGGSDRRLSRFENLFPIPKGVSYNSYVLLDEKTVLFDTADESISRQYIENVVHALNGRPLDYMVVQHMEPDHCAMIDDMLRRYPEAKMVCSAKAVGMFAQFYGTDVAARALVVKEGDKLSTGEHTLHFVMAPMVHWPEVMVTYDEKDKILFSADAFGTFGALNGGVTDEQLDVEPFWEEMRRYYACIVGKYGQPVQRALAKVAPLDIAMICSTHGPVWRREIARVVELYDKVSRYEGEPGAVIAYGSMYGNTEQMAETVARGLAAAGVRPIVVYNLSTADVSQVLRDIFRYDTLVVGSPTYNGQLYPPVDALLRKIAERCIPHRRFACFGSFTWAGAAVRRMTEFAEGMKWPVVGAPVELKQGYSTAVEPACRTLVDALVEDMKR